MLGSLGVWAEATPWTDPLSPLRFSPSWPRSMKGKSSRLRNAAGVELWQRFQRPLQDLQLWRALAQRLLDVTASLPDLPSIHTFLPQIEVTERADPGGWGRPPAHWHFSHCHRARCGPGASDIQVELIAPCQAWESCAQEISTPVIGGKGPPQRQSLVPGVTLGPCTDPSTPFPFRIQLQKE